MLHLYTLNPQIVRLVNEATAGADDLRVTVHNNRRNELPRNAEFVATGNQLSPGLERFAAQYGAMPVVLPEGAEYLAGKARVGDIVVIGSDHRDVKI